MKIKLPNGLLDGADLFNYAEVDELRGKQQNYLADKDLVIGDIGHVPKLLEDLVLSIETKEGLQWKGEIKDAIWKLPAGDLETILIKIRENTFGPDFYHQAICTHCEHVTKGLKLELDKLKLTVLSKKEMLDSKKRVFVLPKSKKEVELRPLYLRDLFDVIKTTINNSDELITSISVLSLKRIDNKNDIAKEDMEKIPSKDIYFIQDKMEKTKVEGHIDTELEVTCEKCKKDFKQKLNVFDPDFFVLTKATNN